jgi:hypothetical protein
LDLQFAGMGKILDFQNTNYKIQNTLHVVAKYKIQNTNTQARRKYKIQNTLPNFVVDKIQNTKYVFKIQFQNTKYIIFL